MITPKRAANIIKNGVDINGVAFKGEDGKDILFLREYDGSKECGTFYITLNGEWIEHGAWMLGEKNLEFNDLRNSTFSEGKHGTFFYPAEGEEAVGYYAFNYHSDNPILAGPGGHAKLVQRGSRLFWEMAQVTPNIAEGQGNSVLVGNKFNGRTGKFMFTAWAYKNCLYVKCLNPEEDFSDEFGAWATLEGIYIRTEEQSETPAQPAIHTSDDGMMYWTASENFTDSQREMLSAGFRESAAVFLKEQFNDGSAEYKNALKLLTAEPMKITADDLTQYTKVRSIQFGVNGFNAYQYFKCRFFPEVRMWHFEKNAGFQRKRGEVYRMNDLELAFTGCWYIGGDEPTYFNDPEHLIVGKLVKVAEDKLMMLFHTPNPDRFGYEIYEFAK